MIFLFLDGDAPRSTSYSVYISQLIRFARVSSHVYDFNTHNKVLTAKFLRQGYRYHEIHKAYSKFYRRHFDIVSKHNIGLKSPPVILLLAVPRRLFYFGSLVILDVVCRYLSLFFLYINIDLGKIDVTC